MPISKMKKALCLQVIIALSFAVIPAISVNVRPIIGIVSEKDYENPGHTYIAASYVKYIESAGARVVPIISTSTEDEIRSIFSSINGVLFPGGGVSLKSSDYFNVSKIIFELAKEANDKSDYFPLWGTCLGFQLLCVLQAGTNKILSDFDAENFSIPLNFTPVAKTSRLFSMYTSESLDWLETEPITMNNHQFGVEPETFTGSSNLNQFYKVLSTNTDRSGKQFISSIEAIAYPFYGVQWHPEKNIFEWTIHLGINHTFHAISIAQTVANFFVEEARKSNHRFATEDDENNSLIYNYPVTFTGRKSSFEQVYTFSS